MGSFSIWHWLIVLVVVVLIFGTKKLRNIGSDVGGAMKNFKDAMSEEKAGVYVLAHPPMFRWHCFLQGSHDWNVCWSESVPAEISQARPDDFAVAVISGCRGSLNDPAIDGMQAYPLPTSQAARSGHEMLADLHNDAELLAEFALEALR